MQTENGRAIRRWNPRTVPFHDFAAQSFVKAQPRLIGFENPKMDADSRVPRCETLRRASHHKGSAASATVRWQNMNIINQATPIPINIAERTYEPDRLRRVLDKEHGLGRLWIGKTIAPKLGSVGLNWAVQKGLFQNAGVRRSPTGAMKGSDGRCIVYFGIPKTQSGHVNHHPTTSA